MKHAFTFRSSSCIILFCLSPFILYLTLCLAKDIFSLCWRKVVLPGSLWHKCNSVPLRHTIILVKTHPFFSFKAANWWKALTGEKEIKGVRKVVDKSHLKMAVGTCIIQTYYRVRLHCSTLIETFRSDPDSSLNSHKKNLILYAKMVH